MSWHRSCLLDSFLHRKRANIKLIFIIVFCFVEKKSEEVKDKTPADQPGYIDMIWKGLQSEPLLNSHLIEVNY